MIPSVVLLDIIKQHRINYVRKWANRFGITEKVTITFKKEAE